MSNTIHGLVTGHIGLNVRDLGRSLDFYTSLFGFTVALRSDEDGRRFAFLSQGDTLIVTLWQQASAEFDGSRAGLHHLSFQVPDLDAVHHFERRLRDHGIRIAHDGVVAHREGAASGGLFFFDPDGTRLEVFTPHGAEGHLPAKADGPSCGFF